MLNLFQHLKLTRFETLKQVCLLQSDSGLHFQVVQQNLLIGEHKRMRYSTKTLILIMFFFNSKGDYATLSKTYNGTDKMVYQLYGLTEEETYLSVIRLELWREIRNSGQLS